MAIIRVAFAEAFDEFLLLDQPQPEGHTEWHEQSEGQGEPVAVQQAEAEAEADDPGVDRVPEDAIDGRIHQPAFCGIVNVEQGQVVEAKGENGARPNDETNQDEKQAERDHAGRPPAERDGRAGHISDVDDSGQYQRQARYAVDCESIPVSQFPPLLLEGRTARDEARQPEKSHAEDDELRDQCPLRPAAVEHDEEERDQRETAQHVQADEQVATPRAHIGDVGLHLFDAGEFFHG